MGKSCFHSLVFILVIALLTAAAPTFAANKNASSNQPIRIEQPDENNLRLLNVRVGPHRFEDLVDAYTYENITLVPLGVLSSLVDLAITVEPEKGIAQGFLYDERNTFYLDISRNEVVLSGRRYKTSPEQIKIYPGDIYIDANLLSEWLPFKLDVDLFSSLLIIKSAEKLPFEQKLEREKRYAEVQNRIAGRAQLQYPGYFEPYSSADFPFMTATLQSSITSNESTGETSYGLNYSLHGTGDLAKMESTFYLSGSKDKPVDQARLTLGRKDREGRLLGRMNAREFAFGHIYAPSSSLITRPQTAEIGAMVSNFPLYQPEEYDRHDFRGELPDGWEVELYHNNSLVGYQQQGTNGQYAFLNIPLYFGRNQFRLVFFGPQGQKREEIHNFDLESSLVTKGTHYYRAQTSQDADGGYQTALQYDYGLGNKVSISTELQSLTLGSTYLLSKPAQQKSYLRAGLRGLFAGVFVSTDVVTDSSSGNAINIGVGTRIGNETLINLKGTKLDNFVSEAFPLLSDPLLDQTDLTLNTAIPASFIPRIPISFRLLHNNYKSGALRSQVDNRISVSYSRIAASNSLSWINSTNQSDQLTGQFQISKRNKKFNLRGDVGYLVQPSSDISSISLTADNIRKGKGLYSFGITQQLQNSSTQYSLNYNRPSGKFSFNVGANYNTVGTTTVTFGLTTGISREPRTPFWKLDSKPVAGMGAVSARVFLDRNQDGIYNAGDEPLPNIQFNRNGNRMPGKTNSEGIAFLTGFTSHYPVNLSIAKGTLDDPLWSPALAGVRLDPRPGSVAQVEFPVLETGEIDGTIYLLRNGSLQAVRDVELEIVNSAGKVITATKSAYDGFYLFSGIPSGQYLVRVSPAQIAKLGLLAVRPLQVTIDQNNQFISGINFRLERK